MLNSDVNAELAKLRGIVASLMLAAETKKLKRKDLMPVFEKRLNMPHPGPKDRYPWKTLKVGENFLVECADTKEARTKVMNGLTSCIANQRARYGLDFIQRKDPAGKGMRVWRVR